MPCASTFEPALITAAWRVARAMGGTDMAEDDGCLVLIQLETNRGFICKNETWQLQYIRPIGSGCRCEFLQRELRVFSPALSGMSKSYYQLHFTTNFTAAIINTVTMQEYP